MSESGHSLDDAVAFRIHRTNRLLRTHLGRLLNEQEPGLTPEQWFVLARLRERGPARGVDLSEPVLGDPPNVSRLIEVLAGRGYVERLEDPADRRARLVSLTESGRALADRLGQAATADRGRVFSGLGESELTALTGALNQIDENLRRLLETKRAD